MGRVAALALAVLGLLGAADAFAAGEKDADANKLYDAAMNDDYLNVELGKAEKKLNDAIKKCGADGCTPKVLAKVYLGLGVIHFANNKADAAKEAFISGLKADPSAKLDDTFKGADIDKIFDDAKKSAGGGSGGGKGGESGGGKGGESGGGTAKPGGGLKHTPPAEQQVNTPVPIYIEIPADLGIKKVTLRYKPFGATSWKPLEMQKVGDGWGVEVPCIEVTTTGDLKYYITADDDSGTVDSAGSRNEPYKVSVKNEIEGDPPSLPGKKPPKQCGGSDCVPGFPKCVDSACQGDGDCNAGLYCSKEPEKEEGLCKKRVAGECKPWGTSCGGPGECCEGLSCVEGSCQEGGGGGSTPAQTSKKRLNQFTVDVSLDMLLLGSRDFVCSGRQDGTDNGPVNDGSYVCFYSSQDSRQGQFYGRPDNTAQGTNGVSGGFAYGGLRFGIGFDRQLTQSLNLTAGIHLGGAISPFPTSTNAPTNDEVKLGHSQANGFLPFWGEVRVGYNLFGGWVEKRKFKPYGYVGFGIGQVNAGVPVTICDTKDVKQSGSGNCPPNSELHNVDAYQITGLNYVPIGIGTSFGITSGFGVKAELRVLFMVPTFGVVFQPTIGPVYAF